MRGHEELIPHIVLCLSRAEREDPVAVRRGIAVGLCASVCVSVREGETVGEAWRDRAER